MGSETRRQNATPIFVRVSAEEKAKLQALAAACSCSVPALMRRTALGHQVTSTLDHQHMLDLMRLRGDLGRIGGLLKLRLTAADGYTPDGESATIRDLLAQLSALQAQIVDRIEAL